MANLWEFLFLFFSSFAFYLSWIGAVWSFVISVLGKWKRVLSIAVITVKNVVDIETSSNTDA